MTVPTTKKPITVAALRHGGTHLITPIIRRLTGRAVYSPKGDSALHCIPSPVVVVFYRDPRNRVISNLRYKMTGNLCLAWNRQTRDENLFEFLSKRKKPGSLTSIEYMIQWEQFWRCDNVIRHGYMHTRFETLVDEAASLGEVTRIASLLTAAGFDLEATPSEALAYSIGQSGTYTGSHSNYREWFGPKSAAYWRREFGHELTKRMGYKVDEELGI